MFVISSCSFYCAIHWNQVLNRKWRCSWSSADRRCSNYNWMIKKSFPTKVRLILEIWQYMMAWSDTPLSGHLFISTINRNWVMDMKSHPFIDVECKAQMGNYIPLFCIDVIAYPYPNPDADLIPVSNRSLEVIKSQFIYFLEFYILQSFSCN